MSSEPDYRSPHYFPLTDDWPCWYSEEITVPMLKEAYWHGIFPWPDEDESPVIPWVLPTDRGLILLEEFHIPRTVLRQMRKHRYELRIDTAFGRVIRNCAERNDGEATWITPEIIRAYYIVSPGLLAA